MLLRRKLSFLLAIAALAVVACSSPALAQNLLANPGFEDPVTSDGPPFVGFWEAFTGSPDAGSGNSTLMPLSGVQSLELSIGPNAVNNFAGVFQDVPILPGQTGTFSGFHKSLGNAGGTEIRIEWKDAMGGNAGATPNFTPLVGSQYEPFSLTATAPMNAAFGVLSTRSRASMRLRIS